MWATRGQLNSFNGGSTSWTDTSNGVCASDLDIYGGQSGSAVWEWPPTAVNTYGLNYQIRALVNTMDSSTGRPYHRTMTKSMFDIVYSWYGGGAGPFWCSARCSALVCTAQKGRCPFSTPGSAAHLRPQGEVAGAGCTETCLHECAAGNTTTRRASPRPEPCPVQCVSQPAGVLADDLPAAQPLHKHVQLSAVFCM